MPECPFLESQQDCGYRRKGKQWRRWPQVGRRWLWLLGFGVQIGEALTAGLVGGGRVGTVGSHLDPHSPPWEAEQMTSPLLTCALLCKVGERQPH